MGASATPAIALSIAGSDSSGGAGIQADLKTFARFGVYGASAITAITAQNTRGVQFVHPVPANVISEQIRSVASDLKITAIKTGMLGSAEAVASVASAVEAYRLQPLVVDPVMVATSGDSLIAEDAVAALRDRVVPLAHIITPNLNEAAMLLDEPVARTPDDMERQARALLQLGCKAVLVKGGHGTGADAIDILAIEQECISVTAPRVDIGDAHGTGCTLSAGITALLARGEDTVTAVKRAKKDVWEGLRFAMDQRIGAGSRPVDQLRR